MANSIQPPLDPLGSPRPTRVRWLVFAMAGLTSYINYVHRYSWGVIRPFLLDQEIVTSNQAGWLDGLFGLTYGLGQFPGGLMGDLMGPRTIIPVVAVLWSCVTAAPAIVVVTTRASDESGSLNGRPSRLNDSDRASSSAAPSDVSVEPAAASAS